MHAPKTLYEKLWQSHVVHEGEGAPTVLYIDLQLLHEVTSPQAFDELRTRGLTLRRPDRHAATLDHAVPTDDPTTFKDPLAETMVSTLRENCKAHGVTLYDYGSGHQGIVHVVGPELGLTRPGLTIVCGDSHTATHGAFGALAFGIGSSEVAHVMATQCILQTKSPTMEIRISGSLNAGVTAKDIILSVIARLGTAGATGFAVEYTGSTIRSLSMEARMTICNMSIEAGARSGLISPDETTFEYIQGRPYAPKEFDSAVEYWRSLATEDGATFDATHTFDAASIEPQVTWGTNPGQGGPITGRVPTNAPKGDLEYTGLVAGAPLIGTPIDNVFIGSCTNARIEDLRAAASILRNKKVAPTTTVMVVPGSEAVAVAAQKEGLVEVFTKAGAQFRHAGCSACLGMNTDTISEGKRCLSTSNRNFRGRQGKGSRTMLASPFTAAATALTGTVTDPRSYLS